MDIYEQRCVGVGFKREFNPLCRMGCIYWLIKIQVSQPVPSPVSMGFFFGIKQYFPDESCDFRSGELLTLTDFGIKHQIKMFITFCRNQLNGTYLHNPGITFSDEK